MIYCNQEIINRFWSKINFPEDCLNDCWIYKGCVDKDGYGIFWTYKNIRAHRFSYMIHNNFKDISQNILVLHTCDNPTCVNPKHLWLGTIDNNNKDKVHKGRSCYGSKHGKAILTEEDVKIILTDIWNDKYVSIIEIANKYKISITAISYILSSKSWIHITNQLQVPLLSIKNKLIPTSNLKKGRPGSRNKSSKLLEKDVHYIKTKLLNIYSIYEISKMYNVSKSTIAFIKQNRSWKHVK